jgi:hypothetical protein
MLTPMGYRVSHAAAWTVLGCGLLVDVALCALLGLGWALLRRDAKMSELAAARHTHELTVAYAAHECVLPVG